MRQLLVINPNTSGHVSELLHKHVQQAAGTHVQVRTVTARFGSPYIADEASYAVAAHATLDAWSAALASAAKPPDAVLIGCFGDPGLMALRESSPVPVTGLAEAALPAAAAMANALGARVNLLHVIEQSAPDTIHGERHLTDADQAEAYFLLVSQRLSKTTGQVITVDGGLHEAFLR